MAVRFRPSFRYVWLAFGMICTVIGIIGVILPGLPGTVFLLLALWAFSKSSERFHLWLYNHRTFGKPMRDWHEYGIIPLKAKILALTMMAASVFYLAAYSGLSDWIITLFIITIVPVAFWIATRPSAEPI